MNYTILSAYAQNNKLSYNELCATVHTAQRAVNVEMKTEAQRDLLYFLESSGAPDEQIARMHTLIAESNDLHTRHLDLLQDVMDKAEWHPIDTAPRSGDILVFCEKSNTQATVKWSPAAEQWVYARFSNLDAEGRVHRVVCSPNPTHWRPLPASPGTAAATVVPPLVHIAKADERAGRFYIAGPMTSIPEWNFPAFNAAAAKLRAEGLDVVNPADHGLVEGADWADYLRYDVSKLAACEGIALLPGWSKSKGAKLEFHIARVLGMQIRPLDGAEAPPCDDDAALRQQSEAWHAVWFALTYAMPGFDKIVPGRTGRDSALWAIGELARGHARWEWMRSEGLDFIKWEGLTTETCDVGLDHQADKRRGALKDAS